MLNHTPDLKAQILQSCTRRMLQAHGLAYLQIMMQYTNCYLDCLRLMLLLDQLEECPADSDEFCLKQLEYVDIVSGFPELPIELTDLKALQQIQNRFAKLRELEKLHKQNHDDPKLDEVQNEIEQLNNILAETYGPKGIKNFLNEQRAKAIHTVTTDIRYFLKNIKKRNENLYYKLKAHLRIGAKCAWLDD